MPVRLNTNESPYPPPAEFVDRVARRARERSATTAIPIATPTSSAPRSADHLDQPAARIFPANGSNEVLQTILLTYGGSGRRALLFEPTYALHAHLARITATEVVEGERDEAMAIDLDSAAALIARHRRRSCSSAAPTTRPAPSSRARSSPRCSTRRAARRRCSWSTRPTASSRAWSALELVDDTAPLVVVRTYSKVWSLAAVRLGFGVGPEWLVAELDKVVLPYHLSVPTQLAGRLALRTATRWSAGSRR